MIYKLYRWYGKRTVWAVFFLVLAIAGYLVWQGFVSGEADTTASPSDKLPLVTVSQVATLRGSEAITLVGSVESIDRAVIESEAAGRVTAVPVSLGDRVGVGTVVARLENSSERAAVLQAEGAYEAAVAGAAQSDVGVAEAENNLTVAKNELASAQNTAINVYRSAYSDANDIVRNTMDQFFSNPDRQITGLRVSGAGNTRDLVDARQELQTLLPEWRDAGNGLDRSDDLYAALQAATTNTQFVLTMVDQFIDGLADTDPSSRYTQADIAAAEQAFAGARATLVANLNAIDSAVTGLDNARESIENAEQALERARIGGTGPAVSSADAQVKQALGSLRAAQANLAKTIIRSPIRGEVNELPISVGDFLGNRDRVAVVANNNALEVTTYVGERDRDRITVGDTVRIGERASGTITTIAPAVDAATGKVEVKIQTTNESLQTGDTVDVTITEATAPTAAATDAPILLPITAIRFTAEDGYVLTVDEGELVREDVTLGRVRGDQVEVTRGVTAEQTVVVDARGLAAGQPVEVTTD